MSPLLTSKRTDRQLVDLARRGDPRALEAIHDRYATPLKAFAARTLADRSHEADDVVQDVFLYAHGALREADEKLELRPWLFWLTRNRSLDRLRRHATAELDDRDAAPAAHEPLEEVGRREDLRRLVVDLARLPEQQRSALVLRELEGLSHAEVASILDVSESASKMLVLRAREGLSRSSEARDAGCAEIRMDLASAHDRRTRPSERARLHMRDCARCRAYQRDLKLTRGRLKALMPIGPFGWLAKLFGGGGALKAAAAAGTVAAVGAVGAYEVWHGQRTTAAGAPSPSDVLASRGVAGESIRTGGQIPPGMAVVRRQVRLPIEARPVRRTVTVTCPAGMLVTTITDPPTLDKTSLFEMVPPLPYDRARTMTFAYRPKPNLAVPGRLTVGVLCQDRAGVDRRLAARRAEAIAALPASLRKAVRAGRAGKVCAADATLYARPGGRYEGAVDRGASVRVLATGKPVRYWTKVFAEGHVMNIGWVKTSRLC